MRRCRVSCRHWGLVIGDGERPRGVASLIDDFVDLFVCASRSRSTRSLAVRIGFDAVYNIVSPRPSRSIDIHLTLPLPTRCHTADHSMSSYPKATLRTPDGENLQNSDRHPVQGKFIILSYIELGGRLRLCIVWKAGLSSLEISCQTLCCR